MVQTVRQIQALKITPARNIAKRPALMHQPVVDDKIERAIERHPGTDPLQRPYPPGPQRNQRNRQHGKDHGVEIVYLKPAGARLVMRQMPSPAPAVHDVPVRQRGDNFHSGNG